MFRSLRSRILAYQFLWGLFALRNGSFGVYLRGLRSGLRAREGMRLKHAELMGRRRISDEEFLQKLRDSERQIYEWQQSRPAQGRSGLLTMYFRLFPCD